MFARRGLVCVAFALLLGDVVVAPPAQAGVAAGKPKPPAPLGVGGTPVGESAHGDDFETGEVLLEPPSAALPSDESLDARLARERSTQTRRPSTAVAGFNPVSSKEDLAERTSNSSTYRNADGTESVVLSNEPVNFQTTQGGWEKIDPRLVPVKGLSGVFETAKSSVRVRVSRDGVELRGEQGQTIRMRPGAGANPLGVPTISADGLSAAYSEVWPGVDLVFTVDNASVTKKIVLKAPGTATSFDMVVEGAGLSALPDGSIASSSPEFAIGDAVMLDKGGNQFEGGAHVDQELAGSSPVTASDALAAASAAPAATVAAGTGSGSSDVTLSVDPAWLATVPASQFPVMIDPSWAWWPAAGSAYAFAQTGVGLIGCAENPTCWDIHVGNNFGGASAM
jgi:hypothetical protein